MLEVLGHCGDGGEALHCEGGTETAGAEGGEFGGGDDFLGFLGGAEERYEDLGGLVGEEGERGGMLTPWAPESRAPGGVLVIDLCFSYDFFLSCFFASMKGDSTYA